VHIDKVCVLVYCVWWWWRDHSNTPPLFLSHNKWKWWQRHVCPFLHFSLKSTSSRQIGQVWQKLLKIPPWFLPTSFTLLTFKVFLHNWMVDFASFGYDIYIYIWLSSFYFLEHIIFLICSPTCCDSFMDVNVSNLIVKRTLKMEGKSSQKKWKDLKILTQFPKSQLPNKLWDEDEWKVWKSSDCQPSQEEKGTTRFWCSNLSQHQFCMPFFVDFLCHSFLCFASTDTTATLYL
jgi:hypothetical protein